MSSSEQSPADPPVSASPAAVTHVDDGGLQNASQCLLRLFTDLYRAETGEALANISESILVLRRQFPQLTSLVLRLASRCLMQDTFALLQCEQVEAEYRQWNKGLSNRVPLMLEAASAFCDAADGFLTHDFRGKNGV